MEERLNKEQLIELMESLEIPASEFWVLSSGALVLRDLFETAGDLDMAVTSTGLECLKKKFNLEQKPNGWYKVNDKVECVLNDYDENKIEKCGKFNLQSLEVYFEYLKSSTREKDKIRYEIVSKELKKRK